MLPIDGSYKRVQELLPPAPLLIRCCVVERFPNATFSRWDEVCGSSAFRLDVFQEAAAEPLPLGWSTVVHDGRVHVRIRIGVPVREHQRAVSICLVSLLLPASEKRGRVERLRGRRREEFMVDILREGLRVVYGWRGASGVV